ncbi:MAG: cell division protein FtsZ [Calditrichaceae bacterium]|nr:cell division protein FtsZ [Calditrichaceae bacterium]
MIQFDASVEQTARIKVIGVGGAGGNALNGMIEAGLTGVEFIAVNTDAQDLGKNKASNRLQIGKNLTKGLGAGANPEVGFKAIEEDKESVIEALNGADMVFVTCGMGGGTGTGAAPIICEIAKDLGALTVGITTQPFSFEGLIRARNASKGIEAMRERVDTMLVIPNDRIFNIIEKNTPVISAFKVVDSLLLEATRSISDLINVHGYINLDFADIRTIMAGMGDALMGTGVGVGEGRALAAAEQAITSPLLDGVDISGARGVLINITGGPNMSMFEVGEASRVVQEAAGNEANVIWGMVIDDTLSEEVRVTVIATGFNKEAKQAKILHQPTVLKSHEYSPNDFSDLDKPTYKRESKEVDKEYPGSPRSNIFTLQEQDVPEGPDELDIPTFLRKQMD